MNTSALEFVRQRTICSNVNPNLPSRPDHPIGRLMWRVFQRDAQRMTIGGVEVVTSSDADIGRTAAVRARLGPALELIDHTTRRLGARLRQDVTAIYLSRVGGISYDPYMQVIVLDVRSGMVGEVEDLAISLVHEATHARQMTMGVRKRPGEELQRRLEARAVAASIAFAEHLPPGTWRKPTLADLEKQWWTLERRQERVIEAAEELGDSPAPFVAAVAFFECSA